ncbi:IPIL1 protein, partial [Irena cyanogastra]|nr:IPIL1 protein [Irena cyanogastra]
MICDLMAELMHHGPPHRSTGFYPVRQEAIGVGSAFEGWSPCAQDTVYSVLVPLSPPRGHTFHLELDAADMPQRNFRVRVGLLCTCRGAHKRMDMLCFLHYREEILRRLQGRSLLDTLCTDSYLDVEKTVQWFCRFLRRVWVVFLRPRHWRIRALPSSRSCRFQVSKGEESFMGEIIFGVRRGDSDIFVGSQPAEVGVPSTTWIETCAVAEAKFFRHISRRAPQDSWHCKCLQLLSHSLMGVGFSSYTLKTVLMHLLNTIPLTQWGSRDFPQRLVDVLKYLRRSLKTKRLHHFVIGNERFPLEISVPSEFRLAEPLNLFQHLASDPDAHGKAMQEYDHLL